MLRRHSKEIDPEERDDLEAVLAKGRSALGETGLAGIGAAGQALTLDEAIGYPLSEE